MSRPRTSLASLMVLVAVVGIGIAALRDASETWAGIVLLLTLGLLGVSILGVIYRREARRAWWLGFGLFGWGYVALTLAPWSKPYALATDDLLDRICERISPDHIVAMASISLSSQVNAQEFLVLETGLLSDAMPGATASDQVVRTWSLHLRSFRSIGHCLLTLLVACVGGVIAQWFHATRGPTNRV